MSTEAFDFVNEICQELGRRVEDDGIETLSEPERVASDVWWASGIIQNGGFQYFYEGATEMAQVADSYDRLGLNKAAEACRKSLRIFPNGVPPEDDDERSEILAPYQGFRNEFFRPLNLVLWETADEGLEDILAVFIHENLPSFGGFGLMDRHAHKFKEALDRWIASLEDPEPE